MDISLIFVRMTAIDGRRDSFFYWVIGIMIAGILAFDWIGLKFLLEGFRAYRLSRFLTNTPAVSVGSASLGPVKVFGTAESAQLIRAPFSQKLCCFYKTTVEFWRLQGSTNEQDGFWQELRTDLVGGRFCLADGTSKILVDAPGISAVDFDVEQTFSDDVNEDFPYLAQYLNKLEIEQQQGSRKKPSGFAARLMANTASPRRRLSEWAVLPGKPYLVLGTCIENPDLQTTGVRYLITARRMSPFRIDSKEPDRRALRQKSMVTMVVGAVFFLGCSVLLIPLVLGLLGRIS